MSTPKSIEPTKPSDTAPFSVVGNPWAGLRQFTAARIALGRAGVSLPTAAHLEFQLAHAQARDAVHLALDVPTLQHDLQQAWPNLGKPLLLHSAAADRGQYLQRPDMGRRLGAASAQALQDMAPSAPAGQVVRDDPASRRYDLALVVADGLSARAIMQNAAPFVAALHARMAGEGWNVAPISIVQQGRVAVGDDVGQRLGARCVVMLIGERPGLSSPDSMGLYLTWMPRVGLTDASRNCISNVRPAGLVYDEAAYKLHYLLSESRQRMLSGVDLKDETASTDGAALQDPGNSFLLRG
ncbi:ethanolamine ammonia-lyase subunit EutC [Curvibacter sp. CHRR-16]|uniref:ethanolamine ammonia-lyase subunit EutC n=1 Tax=Curvibacter sp. CHRR-16 TaxID=2835872 RepID=UPI001BD9991F|nr:ethanolamine ammonia-lyase subunit EutC [Curvibacter sp. CHRR-16]MBT0569818.1 ethanolamine ammonia-lyase subunit EutC [Curvibacter sp. CHRR-16]